MNQNITFPIMDLTEFVFEGERVFFSDLTWEEDRIMKEKYLKRVPEWRYIDSDGKELNVKITERVKINNGIPFLVSPTYKLKLELVNTGHVYQLSELIEEILVKKDKMFHIYHNKIMTPSEYETRLKNAKTFLEVIDIASFEDYKEN